MSRTQDANQNKREQRQIAVVDAGRQLVAHDTTENRRAFAEAAIDLRETFANKQGITDYKGKSWDYRTAFTRLLDEAGLGSTSPHRHLVEAVRYHMQYGVRERLMKLAGDDLAKYHELCRVHGLKPEGPNEKRSRDIREHRVLATESVTPERLVELVQVVRDRLDVMVADPEGAGVEQLAGLSAEQTEALIGHLGRVCQTAQQACEIAREKMRKQAG
ncbi:MAG: hypothetical protein ABIQ18_39780 [Umezawaea sp.]